MRASALVLACLSIACDAGVRLGAACEYSSECSSPSVCALGRCRSECRENRDCPLGARCLLDARGGTCALPDDPDCRDPGEGCPGALACIAGECVNACESVAECPPDAICAPAADGRARCVRADVDSGVPPGDAEIDAGPGACSGPRCVRALASSSYATCALTDAGAVFCWGEQSLGQGSAALPDCGGACSGTPVRVRYQPPAGGETDLQGALRIAGGGLTVCAILPSTEAVCWGATYEGQTGTGVTDGTVARHVRGVGSAYLDQVSSLHGGDGFWIALRAIEPRAVGWGAGGHDRLLDGAGPGFRELPVEAALPSGAWLASGGHEHACAISGDGLRCWGANDVGQAGAPVMPVTPPSPVTGVAAAAGLALTRYGGCAIDGDDVRCWGSALVLGGASAMPGCSCEPTAQPVIRAGATAFHAIATSPTVDTVLALDAEGDVWCWGVNEHRQCQREEEYSIATPIVRRGLPGPASSISVGLGHVCALVAGVPWCWGSNEHGQLGRGAPTLLEPDPAPVVIPE